MGMRKCRAARPHSRGETDTGNVDAAYSPRPSKSTSIPSWLRTVTLMVQWPSVSMVAMPGRLFTRMLIVIWVVRWHRRSQACESHQHLLRRVCTLSHWRGKSRIDLFCVIMDSMANMVTSSRLLLHGVLLHPEFSLWFDNSRVPRASISEYSIGGTSSSIVDCR